MSVENAFEMISTYVKVNFNNIAMKSLVIAMLTYTSRDTLQIIILGTNVKPTK